MRLSNGPHGRLSGKAEQGIHHDLLGTAPHLSRHFLIKGVQIILHFQLYGFQKNTHFLFFIHIIYAIYLYINIYNI